MANVEGVLSGVCVAALIVIAVVDERTLEIPPICNWLIGIAGGIKEGLLFKKGEIIRKVKQEDIVKVLKEEILKMI